MSVGALEWFETTLGESFQTVTGNTPPKSNGELYGQAIPFVKPPELIDGEVDSATDGLSKKGSKLARIAPVGSTLVSCIGNLGKIGLTTAEVAFNQQINAIFPAPRIAVPKFVYYLTLSSRFRDQLLALSTGTTVPIVNKTRFNSIKLTLPPIEEQKRIAAVLDQAFAALDRARAHVEANLADATELFEASLRVVFDSVASETSDRALSDIAGTIVDCEHKTAPVSATGYPSVRTPNVGKGVLHLDGVNRVSEETYREWTRRAIPESGDLIMAREAPAGNVAVIPEGEKVCLGQRTLLIKVDRELTDPSYLALLLLHPMMQRNLLQKSAGATVQHVNMKDIRALRMPKLPCMALQKECARRVNEVRAKAKLVEAAAQEKIVDLSNLRQSLLQKAFSGNLT